MKTKILKEHAKEMEKSYLKALSKETRIKKSRDEKIR